MHNEKNNNNKWEAFDQEGFSGYYRVENGALVMRHMMEDGSMETGEDVTIGVEYLVSGEREMGFLEAINERLGTDFKYSDFITED